MSTLVLGDRAAVLATNTRQAATAARLHPLLEGGFVMAYRIRTLRLTCTTFIVDTRYVQLRRGRWIASADTPGGPTLGYGTTGFAAMWMALQPFEGVIEELLASIPTEALSSPD